MCACVCECLCVSVRCQADHKKIKKNNVYFISLRINEIKGIPNFLPA